MEIAFLIELIPWRGFRIETSGGHHTFFTCSVPPEPEADLFSDLNNLKRGGVRFRPGVGLLRSGRNGIILFGGNQEDVMRLRIERNRARAISGLHVRDRTDLVR